MTKGKGKKKVMLPPKELKPKVADVGSEQMDLG